MVDMQYFAKMLRKCRKERGLTQSELAEKLLVSAQSVSIWESGKGLPDLDHLCELSRVLAVSIDGLLDNQPNEVKSFIGIDGGGTKTEFALIDETGRKLNSIILGGCNPNACGIEEAISIVCRGIDFLRPAEMNVAGIFLGGAGLGSGNNAQVMRDALQKAHPNIKVDCASDISNVIACCSRPDHCIAAISGTGCVVFSSCNGTLQRTGGGAGYLFEGRGSGYDMGRDAIMAVLQAGDETGEKTLLTQLVEEKLGGNAREHIHQLYKEDIAAIASFSLLVSQAAQQGDAVACAIMERNSGYVAHLIRSALKKEPTVRNVILSGSLFMKNDSFFQSVTAGLDPGLTVERMSCPPVWGACLQAVKLCQPEKMPSLELFMESEHSNA